MAEDPLIERQAGGDSQRIHYRYRRAAGARLLPETGEHKHRAATFRKRAQVRKEQARRALGQDRAARSKRSALWHRKQALRNGEDAARLRALAAQH